MALYTLGVTSCCPLPDQHDPYQITFLTAAQHDRSYCSFGSCWLRSICILTSSRNSSNSSRWKISWTSDRRGLLPRLSHPMSAFIGIVLLLWIVLRALWTCFIASSQSLVSCPAVVMANAQLSCCIIRCPFARGVATTFNMCLIPYASQNIRNAWNMNAVLLFAYDSSGYFKQINQIS